MGKIRPLATQSLNKAVFLTHQPKKLAAGKSLKTDVRVKFRSAASITCLVLLSMDAMLRINSDSHLSASKVLVVILFAATILKYPLRSLQFILFVAAIISYSFLVAHLSDYGLTADLYRFTVHFILASSCIFLGVEWSKSKNFTSCTKTLTAVFWIIFLSAFISHLISWSFPNIRPKPSVARGWFGNENDISMLLMGVFFLISVLSWGVPGKIRFLALASASFYIAFLNEARVVMISFALFLFLYFSFFAVRFSFLKVSRAAENLIYVCIVGTVFSILSILLVLPSVFERLEPAYRVVSLTPYGIPIGSIYNRVDATIYGIFSFFDNYMLGVGLGNSISLIHSGKYGIIESAGSMHNIFIQLLVELGFVFLGLLFLLLRKSTVIILTLFWVPFLLNSLSQSSGIFSNYFYLFSVGVAFCKLNSNVVFEKRDSSRLVSVLKRSDCNRQVGLC